MVRIDSAVKMEELYTRETRDYYFHGMEVEPFSTYLEEVTARTRRLAEKHPNWDPNSMYCVWMAVSTVVTRFPMEQAKKSSLAGEDWRGMNNAIFQDNRLRCIELAFQEKEIAPYWYFLQALTAIAAEDDTLMEWIYPAGMKWKKQRDLYPLYRVGAPLLAGLWYRDEELLDSAAPGAEEFVSSKKPQWERAVVACLLALYRRDVEEAGARLQTVCKTVTRGSFLDYEKEPFFPAHGLYQLAARVLGPEKFQHLPVPEYKTFSKGYAQWHNTPYSEEPELYLKYPEPAEFINDSLAGRWTPRRCQ